MFTFRQIEWWPAAYHVYEGDKRLGIVNKREIRFNGDTLRVRWFAFNTNVIDIGGEYTTYLEAAQGLKTGASSAF